ncbi:MAG: VOC family protein [Planctomycetota bacterium]|nr:VOC family protein [Planctomycetota bacterium]
MANPSSSNDVLPPFHLAFPVVDLQATRSFYEQVIGCRIGRTSDRWIDFDFFGHQVTAHLVDCMPQVSTNPVDGKQVPSSHFGAVLDWESWHRLRDRLVAGKLEFLIGPYLRFQGEPGEQATLFITDPSGNGLEFKSFKNPDRLFAT